MYISFRIVEYPKLFHLSAGAVFIVIAYLVSIAIYNVFFHPLRKYPGPILNRMTHLVYSLHLIRGDIVHHVGKLHEKYGDLVRLSPTELSYLDQRAWPDIYGHTSSSGIGNLPKDPNLQRSAYNGAKSIITADTIDHRRLRRIQTHMFSEKALNAQEPLINEHISKLIACFEQKAHSQSNIIDVCKWYRFATNDILGELAFGQSFGCLDTGVSHPWLKIISDLFMDGGIWRACEKLPQPLNILAYKMCPTKIRASRALSDELAVKIVRDRMSQDSTDRVDFMSYILRHNDEKGMTVPEIENNAQILVLAGSDPTSTFLSGVTFNLLNNPQHLARLTNLIRTHFPFEKDITMSALGKLEYFSAIFEESFRIYPPVPSGLPRITTAGGSMICGELVPEFTTVSVAHHAANLCPRNWADPKEFVPERWYKGEKCPERYRADNRKVMNPFGYGPRNCIGRNLAIGEMRLIIARVLWNFDLELQPDCLNWLDQKVYGLWQKPPLNVKFVQRNIPSFSEKIE